MYCRRGWKPSSMAGTLNKPASSGMANIAFVFCIVYNYVLISSYLTCASVVIYYKTKSTVRSQKKNPTLLPTSMPRALYMLYCYCKVALEDGRGLQVDIADDVFGSECTIYIFLDDIIPFCELQPITANCLVVYIWYRLLFCSFVHLNFLLILVIIFLFQL